MGEFTPYSDLKIFYHTEAIRKLLNGERNSPIYVRIKPTNVCNQQCYYCAYADSRIFSDRHVEKRSSIPWDILSKTLYELKEMGLKAVTFSGGGEPLCYPKITDALQLVKQLEVDYSIITNGQALCGEAADLLRQARWVRISFDSAKRETYESIRGVGTYEKVIDNIRTFASIKDKRCALGINCVVTQSNAGEIYEICDLVKKLGVNNIKISPILIKKDQKDYHDKIKKYAMEQIDKAKMDLEDSGFRIIDKYSNDIALDGDYKKEYSRCWIQNFFAVIAADSKVYRCHQRAYTKTGELGDLAKRSFKEIWYDPETIKGGGTFNPEKECRFRCAFDERNRLLNDFMNIDKDHINFI